jgi:hypothetical protein
MASKADLKAIEAAAEASASAAFLRPAYRLFVSKQVRQDLIFPALRILAAYLSSQGLDREPEALCGAALYLAFRHPNTYPNPVPRSYFALHAPKKTKRHPADPLFDDPFKAKETSIDWYAKRLIEKLNIIVLYDERGLPYFLERSGPIYRLVEALAEEAATNAVLISHVANQHELVEAVVNELLDRVLNVLRLVPSVFRVSLYEHLAPEVEALVENTKWALGL